MRLEGPSHSGLAATEGGTSPGPGCLVLKHVMLQAPTYGAGMQRFGMNKCNDPLQV